MQFMNRELFDESVTSLNDADKRTTELTITYSAFLNSTPSSDLISKDLEFHTALEYIKQGRLPQVATGITALYDAVLRKISEGVFRMDFCTKCVRCMIYPQGIRVYYLCWNTCHEHNSIFDRGSVVDLRDHIHKASYQTNQINSNVQEFNGQIATNLLSQSLGDIIEPVKRRDLISCQVRSTLDNGEESRAEVHKFKRPTVEVNYFSFISTIAKKKRVCHFDVGSDLTLTNKSFVLDLISDDSNNISKVEGGETFIDFKVANGTIIHSSCDTYLIPMRPFEERPDVVFELLCLAVEDRHIDLDGLLIGRNNMTTFMLEYRFDPTTRKPFLSSADYPDLRSPFLTDSELSIFRSRNKQVYVDDDGQYNVRVITTSDNEAGETYCFEELYAVAADAAWERDGRSCVVDISLADSNGVLWDLDPEKSSCYNDFGVDL